MTDKRTGEYGFRIQTRLFGKPFLVLQVEMERAPSVRYYDGHDGYYDTDEIPGFTYWQDATVIDLQAIKVFS